MWNLSGGNFPGVNHPGGKFLVGRILRYIGDDIPGENFPGWSLLAADLLGGNFSVTIFYSFFRADYMNK